MRGEIRTRKKILAALLSSGLEIPTILDLGTAEQIIEVLKTAGPDYSEDEDFQMVVRLLRAYGVPEERIKVAALGVLLGVLLRRIGQRNNKKKEESNNGKG